MPLHRTRNVLVLAATFALALASHTTRANAQIIKPGDTWKYVNTDANHLSPVSTSGFELPGYDDSQWFSGHAPFGNVGSGDFGNQNGTFWGVDYDPLVRRTFTLASPTDLIVDLGVDNGYALYINGTLVSSDNAEGYTSRWEYTFPINKSLLVAGTNVIAVALEDHGGLTAFDMQLRHPRNPNTVPEPGALALLFGSAVPATLFAVRRLRRR